VRNPIVSWPQRIKDKGGLRPQFLHIIDVTPTVEGLDIGMDAAHRWTSPASCRSGSRAPSTRSPSISNDAGSREEPS
jgi:arylsulfatase A-like enzyme